MIAAKKFQRDDLVHDEVEGFLDLAHASAAQHAKDSVASIERICDFDPVARAHGARFP